MKKTGHCLYRYMCGVLLPLAVFIMLVTLTSCDRQEKQDHQNKQDEKIAEPPKPVIGVLLYRADDAYIAMVWEAMQKEFQGHSEVIMFDGASEQLLQDEQLDLLLKQNVDALVINLVDIQSAAFLIDKVKKSGIPAVFFNREPSGNDLKSYDKAWYVGTVPLDAGKIQGDLIKKIWASNPEYDRNKDNQFQYIMVQASPDNPESLARTEYSVRHARELGVAMQQVGATFMCGWDENKAYETIRHSLPGLIDSVELVIANNDAMALGAVRCLTELGYNTATPGGHTIPVIGVDATSRAMEAIRSGMMAGTVEQNSQQMANVIVTLVLNAVHQYPLLKDIDLSWDDSGNAIRIPYAPIDGESTRSGQ